MLASNGFHRKYEPRRNLLNGNGVKYENRINTWTDPMTNFQYSVSFHSTALIIKIGSRGICSPAKLFRDRYSDDEIIRTELSGEVCEIEKNKWEVMARY